MKIEPESLGTKNITATVTSSVESMRNTDAFLFILSKTNKIMKANASDNIAPLLPDNKSAVTIISMAVDARA